MLVVVGASAWLRLMSPRASCSDWPACRVAAQGLWLGEAPQSAPEGAGLVRGLHRAAASGVLVLVIALVVLAARAPRHTAVHPTQRAAQPAGDTPSGARPRGALRPALGLPLALLALALALSVLGIATPGSRSALMMLGNLLGGFAMLALALALARRLSALPLPLPPRWRAAAAAGALLWFVQAAAGALSGAPPASGTTAPVLHFVLALIAASWAFAVGLAAHAAGRRREALALLALCALQVGLGIASALAGAAPALVQLHNAGAALGLAVLTSLAMSES
jgi:cytochrome c oxidase assembly protein subunit 15